MAYRFTNTDKWGDAWFSELKPIEKLLFNYLCDNCDIAGFIEITIKKWAMDIGSDRPQIEGALKGLSRGLIYSLDADCIFLRNFLKHQKNIPLCPERNPAHRGIIKRFENYALKFEIIDINDFILSSSKGLGSPLGNGKDNGNGLGIGKGKGNDDVKPEKQVDPITQNPDFILYEKWIKENCPIVCTLKKQMTEKEFLTLKKNYTGDKIADVLMAMENYKRLTTSYTSVYLTLNKWLLKDSKDGNNTTGNRTDPMYSPYKFRSDADERRAGVESLKQLSIAILQQPSPEKNR